MRDPAVAVPGVGADQVLDKIKTKVCYCHCVLQGDMHMVAARLGCQSAMVGTGWVKLLPWLHGQA